MEYTVKSIGTIKQEKGQFSIALDETYRGGLTALEGFQFLQILWWADQVDQEELRNMVLLDKPYTKGPEKIGVFATRSPVRPNPLALSIIGVMELRAEEGIITTPYIDAEPGTPVLDIKPYHPSTERVKDVGVPSWCRHWPQWYEDSAHFDWEAEFNFDS